MFFIAQETARRRLSAGDSLNSHGKIKYDLKGFNYIIWLDVTKLIPKAK